MGSRVGDRENELAVFQASLGHIEMRRMRLPEAREQLARALALSCVQDMIADRAAILHNLAIVQNQLNDFALGRRTFREAEKLLRRTGKEREAIKIHTNLARETRKLLDATREFEGFVISSGCDVPPGSPIANLQAFFETAAQG